MARLPSSMMTSTRLRTRDLAEIRAKEGSTLQPFMPRLRTISRLLGSLEDLFVVDVRPILVLAVPRPSARAGRTASGEERHRQIREVPVQRLQRAGAVADETNGAAKHYEARGSRGSHRRTSWIEVPSSTPPRPPAIVRRTRDGISGCRCSIPSVSVLTKVAPSWVKTASATACGTPLPLPRGCAPAASA